MNKNKFQTELRAAEFMIKSMPKWKREVLMGKRTVPNSPNPPSNGTAKEKANVSAVKAS